MISVICPTYNEANSIRGVIEFFISSKPLEKELLIIDGNSTDDTRSIVKEYLKKHNNINLIDNPERYVSFAMNKGIQAAKGDIIVRLDAHSIYSDDYFEKILETFEYTKADIVGGPYLTYYRNDFQKAVAKAISSTFGIGNSKAHNASYKGYVDSVPYGAFKKKIFEEIGLFDEQLIRNQDDEFNYRANSLGKKVFLNPAIKFWYGPRHSFWGLFKQYFQYGYYKPLVLKKVRSGIKLRHLIPALFVFYVLLVLLIKTNNFLSAPLVIYLLAIIFNSVMTQGNIKVKIFSLLVYPTIHLSYGLGFLIGLNTLLKGAINNDLTRIKTIYRGIKIYNPN
ncbi:MAG TPA: glycosyltransferase family 2 protein [Ignavibacteriaceae bacterium]|nr:glycosyltransferase family 2 protein [Ignavibacteriaceae bacterium]